MVTPLEMIDREVVVVPETVTNSLIISATKRYLPVIDKLVEEIDRRPEIVEVRILIAEVDLTNVDELGMELGLQEPILFRRSVNGVPGFLFNTPTLGNSSSADALATAGQVGTQALSNLAMGRTNADAGFGGLILSASSESVSVLIRALKSEKRLEVLASPKITTLNNQMAYVLVGQRVPQVTGLGISGVGTAQSGVDYTDVGISLLVTPRVSPDGMVVMQVTAERSDVGPLSEGIPIGIGADGTPILAPRINSTRAETVASAADGQTVVLGGLINKQRSTTSRKVPYLADVPLVGSLFRYDVEVVNKTELLIILTPTVIKSEDDMERLKRTAAGRISWCLSDVIDIYGDPGVRGRRDEWRDDEVPVTYPDQKKPPARPGAAPNGKGQPEELPAPEGPPNGAASPGATPPLPPVQPGGNAGANLPAGRLEPRPGAPGPHGPGPETPVSFLQGAPALYAPPNPLRGAE
jgi:type II secretory pathway component GspD/PulD (secretin)